MKRPTHCPSGHEYTPENSGHASRGDRYCKICKRLKVADWRNKARQSPETLEEMRAYQRKWANKRGALVRQEALDAYGRVCACCGESNEIFLALEHLNDDGADHRRSLGGDGRGGSKKVYYWARKNNWPPIFQILCHNCNWAKSRGGCPHNVAA